MANEKTNNLEIDSSLGRYRIVRKIGAGGMGEVYLARDSELERDIALKVLPAEFCCDGERVRRFKQEARAASALNHPNIITIHEIGEVEDRLFIATEYIDGETLRDKIKKNDLSVYESVRIAEQIAVGLSVAHKANIIHRDIKPENIMIRRDGYAKILDFGLAKLVEKKSETPDAEAETRMKVDTRPGVVMGSVSYMPPEQARGGNIDERTDVWSLGVCLYEMLTGENPFARETVSDSLAALIHIEPEPLDANLPAELQRIVRKTLQKDAGKRYQNVKDLLIDLEDAAEELKFQNKLERTASPNRGEAKTQIINATTTDAAHTTSSAEYIASEIKQHKRGFVIGLAILILAAVGLGFWYFSNRSTNTKQIESIAVLPFENKNSDADTEYLSDGLAESLIYRLSQLPDLKVSPTSSVFRYKGKETDAVEVGSELGVQAVMSGRIVQRGDNLNISVELVDVRNNKLIWGEQYGRKMSELLATQREIATEIAQKLQLKLSGEGEKMLTKQYTDNNEAYQLYLKGRYHYAKRTKDDILKGIEYFQQAIKLDPNFASAYVGVSDSYTIMPFYGYLSPKEAFPQAKAMAQRAIDTDPALAEAHAALADVTGYYERDWTKADREFKRAIELNPNVPEIHFSYGYYLHLTGRSDEAIRELKRALEIEPLSIPVGANLAGAYMHARQNDLALEQAKKTYNLEPNHPAIRFWLGVVYIASGMNTEAIALGERALQNDQTNQDALYITGYAHAKSGRRHEAEEVIKKFKDIARTQYVMSYYVASIYAALGDKDKAFAELEKSFAEGDSELPRLKVDPLMDSLRDDARYKDLLRRTNLSE